eukprot:TRINITY_DN36322_c0_g1_i1.p1 TRINITY_DN36322_c0_g1~~TRINITY_DN36322_c0_g1_i1.p1  ORF type:complete len:405 (-),score=100.75 TRINITY_DN36322_c0_g1_i1:75-1235(-)
MPVPIVENLSNEISNESEASSNVTSQATGLAQPGGKLSSRVRSNTEKAESGLGDLDDDSELENAAPHPLQQERTRQKKFIKNFKHLHEETVFERISCALVGDILLQGHLYVTENYLAFHSNVFGYVTRIQLSMTSVTAIKKEKTAKIIPNAVAVSTQDEVHTFTSFISRDATYKVMTKVWRRALAKSNIIDSNLAEEVVDGEENNHDYESTDSENSTNPEASYAKSQRRSDKKKSYPVQRMSMSPGSMFYQARIKDSGHNQSFCAQNSKSEEATSKSMFEQLSKSLQTIPASMYLLITLIILLILLFISSTYLVLKLDNIQEKVEFSHPSKPLSDWQSLLHTQSSKKVQEYLNTNLEQISQVRDSLEKLSHFLQSESKRNDEKLHQ